MDIGPIIKSMRHHKGAFSLLVLEVAFGFVILVHTVVGARFYSPDDAEAALRERLEEIRRARGR